MDVPFITLVRDGRRVKQVGPGKEIEVLLPATPFYIEAGGQVSDTGYIVSDGRDQENGPAWQIQVTDTRQPLDGLVLHVGRVIEGQPREGDPAQVQVDVERRMDIMRNHSATHLLHRGLRQVLGSHVQQAGSLVAPDRLRFDFTHHAMVSEDELSRITRAVNEAILANYPLNISHEPYDEALESGVVALFGEKYGDIVRVVRVGESGEFISQELCGGTHVSKTGDIGLFHIVSESSVGAGLRRIEAVTGRAAQQLVEDRLNVLDSTAAFLDCQPEEVDREVMALAEETQAVHKELDQLKQALARREFESLMSQAQDLDGIALLARQVKVDQVETLRKMADWFRERHPSSAVVLGAVIDERPLLIAAVTADLVARGLRADELVRQVARVIGGGGGGRPTLAQAGGRDANRLDEALSGVPGLVAEKLAGHD
jgi:alanyl-tRNA synthetase